MKIRTATPADTQRLVALSRLFYESHRLNAYVPFDEESAFAYICCLLDASHVFVRVAEVDGVVVGFIAAATYPLPFNITKTLAQELHWFVDPVYRATSAGARLYAAYAEWAKDADVQVTGATVELPELGRFYARRGFEPYETHYIKGK